ncbi:MAG: GNAT family N-acetyltransferase, partial [Pseudomonadota bacterium]
MPLTPHEFTFELLSDTTWPEAWPMLKTAFEEGASYPCPMDMAEEDARTYWMTAAPGLPKWSFLTRDHDGTALGTFYIRTDQGGLGDHVCNAGYVVAPGHSGKGIAKAMCRWSQGRAAELGFKAMRFNLVVATNLGAIKAWTACGFEIVGTVHK